jgi:hypothetical protein
MGIYWCAIDEHRKEKIEPPLDFSIKAPGFFHPNSPFPGMVMMMNYFGGNFTLINDADWEGPYYSDEYKDITQEVYEKYIKYFPEKIL